MAAKLSQKGFTGPESALEGTFGFLNVFCPEHDFDQLTLNLGQDWLTLTTMHKRYACHITAHTPVESAVALRHEFQFKPEDIEQINIECNERSMRANNIPAPKDILIGQYSIPFCVALSMYRNPVDPRSFDESAVQDARIMALAKQTIMRLIPPPDHRSDMTSVVTIKLKNGQELSKRSTAFLGTPERPLEPNALREKFLLLCLGDVSGTLKPEQIEQRKKLNVWFDRIQNLEQQSNLNWIRT
jgi:2-methylcitrate dehydratase PrpD